MPMIMDGGINVDDLFGESASLELGLPATAPTSNSTKGLAQRLDEMRLLGCCQYVIYLYSYNGPAGLYRNLLGVGKLPGLNRAALHISLRIH